MKASLVFLSLFFSLSIVAQNGPSSNESSAIESAPSNPTKVLSELYNFSVIGKIKNYVKNNDNQFIRFRTYPISGVMNDSLVPIKEDGSFRITQFLPYEGDIKFLYQGTEMTLYTQPYELVQLEIDEAQWIKEDYKSKAIKIDGLSASISKAIMGFSEILSKNSFVRKEVDNNPVTLSDSSLVAPVHQWKKQALDLLKSYLSDNNITDPASIEWCTNEVLLQASFEANLLLFGGRINDKVSYEQYLFYNKALETFKQQPYHNSNFYVYANAFSKGLQIITNINPAYKEASEKRLSQYMDVIKRYVSGITLDLSFFHLYNTRTSKEWVAKIDSVIGDEYVKAYLYNKVNKDSRPFEEFNYFEKLGHLPGGIALANKISNELKKQPSNIFFFDFWSLGCSPCMAEMKFYSKLDDVFKKENITMVYLGQNPSKFKSKQLKEKYNLKGLFFDLNTNEVNLLNLALNFNAIPAHFAITKNGDVLQRRFPPIQQSESINSAFVDALAELGKNN